MKENNVTVHSHTRSHCHGDSGATKGQMAPQVIDERAQVSVRHQACKGRATGLLAGPATDTVDIQYGATTQKENAALLRLRLQPVTLRRRRRRSQVRAHMHTERTRTHTGNTTSTTTAMAWNQGGVFLFLPSVLEGAEESMGGGRGGEGRRDGREGGRGGSMHLWRAAGKGHFSLHGSAPAVCSLLVRAFMSKYGDFFRSRERWGEGGWGGESPRRKDGEEEEVGGRTAIEGDRSVDASQCELNPQYSHI